MPLPAALDRRLLHLFVYGPGYGEGIAVALPGAGWLIVDGCRTPGDAALPLVDLLDTFLETDEAVDALLLTHPHDDHFHGFTDVLHEFLPHRVGLVTGGIGLEPLARALAEQLAQQDAARDAERGRAGGVAAVLNAIDDTWLRRPESRLELYDGVVVPTSSPHTWVTVRAPAPHEVVELVNGHAAVVAKRLRQRANELSAVIEIEFGATRVVLGGDLPTLRSSGQAVPSGWGSVMPRRPELGAHCALKLPHHTSLEAFHPELHSTREVSDRAWVATPWSRGRGLPRTEPQQGLARLLEREPEVLLTGLPLATEVQARLPGGRVSLSDLHRRVVASRTNDWTLIDLTAEPGTAGERMWAVAFDDAGAIVQRWPGDQALRVVAS